MPNAKQVPLWMLEQSQRETYLVQEEVVDEIQSRFGRSFVYENENDNLATSAAVLREFT